jgi:U3 small nucleolar RNA-associated protein 7
MNRLKEEIARRKRQVETETNEAAAKHFYGRKMTDANAMRRPEARHAEDRARRAPKRMAKMAVYHTEESNRVGLDLDVGEVPDRVAQRDIVEAVDEQTRNKKFDITLDQMGPYACAFSPNGADVALCGLRGHLATFRWQQFDLQGEVQLKDKCTDVTYLVDNSMLAVAQKRFVYMYTKAGVEMHLLQNMANCDKLAYLNQHMLLAATSSTYSVLHYMDVSTGKTVTSKGPGIVKDPTVCINKNPANGVVATGDLRGVVKLWSPTVEDPLVQLKAHKGAVKDVLFHPDGRFALTLGVDSKFKIWDIRTLRTLEEYGMNYTVDSVDVSANGLVALGGGTGVQIWKGLFDVARPRGPYMKHTIGYGNIIHKVQFCPFEDVLGIGHSRGFCTMLVPGSGEANPDFFRANPYETEMHRKQRVVGSLLDKLPAETISMDLQIAGVDEDRLKDYHEKLEKQRKLKGIKERKAQRKEGRAAVAPTFKPNAEDEVDEELGVKEAGVSKLWKPKAELVKERKMANWQKKDASDKVRSKQTMRASRIAKQTKARTQTTRIMSGLDEAGGDDATAAAPPADAEARAPRQAHDRAPKGGDKASGAGKKPREAADKPAAEVMANAALRRLFR